MYSNIDNDIDSVLQKIYLYFFYVIKNKWNGLFLL